MAWSSIEPDDSFVAFREITMSDSSKAVISLRGIVVGLALLAATDALASGASTIVDTSYVVDAIKRSPQTDRPESSDASRDRRLQ